MTLTMWQSMQIMWSFLDKTIVKQGTVKEVYESPEFEQIFQQEKIPG